MIFVSHLKSKHSCLSMSSLNDVHTHKTGLNVVKQAHHHYTEYVFVYFLLDLNYKLKLHFSEEK